MTLGNAIGTGTLLLTDWRARVEIYLTFLVYDSDLKSLNPADGQGPPQMMEFGGILCVGNDGERRV